MLQKIDNLECSEAFRGSNFGLSYYKTTQGRKQPMVRLYRDAFALLTGRFTSEKATERTEAYIALFNEYEAMAKAQVTSTSQPTLE